jgi:hypothetical protein
MAYDRGAQIPDTISPGASTFCTAVPKICGLSELNLLYVTLLPFSPRILRCLVDFWEICVPVAYATQKLFHLKFWMISAFFSGTTARLGGKGTPQGKGTWKGERARKAEGWGSGARSQETQRIPGGLWWWTWWCEVLQVSTFCLLATCVSLTVFFDIFLLQLCIDHQQYHMFLRVHLSGKGKGKGCFAGSIQHCSL